MTQKEEKVSFEEAYEHLLQRIKRGGPWGWDGKRCVYFKGFGGGCGIGAHIPDDLYCPEMEGLNIWDVFSRYPHIKAHFQDGVPWMALQTIHDLLAPNYAKSASGKSQMIGRAFKAVGNFLKERKS